MDGVYHLVIANVAEFNRRQLDGISTERELSVWDRGSSDLEDMALFWGGDHSLVVLPGPPSQIFVQDCARWLGWRSLSTVSPGGTGPYVCDSLLSDRDALASVARRLKQQSNEVEVMTWGATEGLYRLLDELAHRDVPITATDVPPREVFWIARHLETKAGFRQFASAIQGEEASFQVPYGFLCGDLALAIEATSHFAAAGKAFVLKANNGTAGFSSISYGPQELDRGHAWIVKDAKRRMSFDSLWQAGCVVIEEMITNNEGDPATPVTVDFFVHSSGRVDIAGRGTMIIRGRHLYGGVKCGLGALPDENVGCSLNKVAAVIGSELSRMGYTGWCDVDCLVPERGALYINEINVRRASPSHAFSIASTFAGPEWERTCGVYANDRLPLQGSCRPTYTTLRTVFEEFNKRHGASRCIAVPTLVTTSLSGPTPFVGYAIVASTVGTAEAMAVQLEAELRSSVGMEAGDARQQGSL
jgi:hypothetical protein